MTTITIDARLLGGSGIGTYLENLLRELSILAPADLKFRLLGNPEKIQQVVGENPIFDIIEAKSPIYSPGEQMEIPKLARGTDLLHIPHHNVPILWRGKLLVTFHDALHWDHPEYIPDWRGKIYLKLVSHRIRHADWIITPSKFTADRVREIFDFPSDRISAIPEGVDTGKFFPREETEVREVLAEYGLEWKGFILYVGNMKPHKNIPKLVEGYQLARQKGVKIPLVLAGKIAGLRGKVDVEKFSSFPGVKYIGEIPHGKMAHFYTGACALAFVSLYEGFGLPPLEAMACGCPVLASNAASLPEVVDDAAVVVNPHDVGEIAAGLAKICLDLELRKRLIERGYANIARFSWRKMAEHTLDIYRKLTGGEK